MLWFITLNNCQSACELIDSLAKIPGPRCQWLQWGLRPVDREWESFHASSCWQLFIMGTSTSSVQCYQHTWRTQVCWGRTVWAGRSHRDVIHCFVGYHSEFERHSHVSFLKSDSQSFTISYIFKQLITHLVYKRIANNERCCRLAYIVPQLEINTYVFFYFEHVKEQNKK